MSPSFSLSPLASGSFPDYRFDCFLSCDEPDITTSLFFNLGNRRREKKLEENSSSSSRSSLSFLDGRRARWLPWYVVPEREGSSARESRSEGERKKNRSQFRYVLAGGRRNADGRNDRWGPRCLPGSRRSFAWLNLRTLEEQAYHTRCRFQFRNCFDRCCGIGKFKQRPLSLSFLSPTSTSSLSKLTQTGGAAPSAPPPAGYPGASSQAQGGLRYGYPGAAQYPPGAQQYPPTAGYGYAGAAPAAGYGGQMPPPQYYGQQPGMPPQGYGQGAPMYAG